MRCSRREFIKALPLLFAGSASFASTVDLFTSFILAGDCAYCKLKGLCCRKRKFGVCVRWGLKYKYRIPVGFLEANHSCSFLVGLIPIVGEGINTALQTICNAIPPPFHISSKLSRMNLGSGLTQSRMRVHARWYSIPKPLKPFLETVYSVKLLCPCFDLKITENLPVVGTYMKMINKLEEKINELERRTGISDIRNRLERLKQIVENFKEITNVLPLFITEPISLFWLTDIFNPDVYTLGYLYNRIITLGGNLGAVTCPYLLDALRRANIDIPVVDPTFICVGHWGFGYPRMGVVRHDNYVIAQLLALARFHHLFTKTFPVIDVPYNPDKLYWQIVHPKTTGCFRIGYWGVLDVYDIKDLTDGNLTANLQRLITVQMAQMVSAVTEGWRRDLLVLVWERRSKCCGI